jgi:hypothetical protein
VEDKRREAAFKLPDSEYMNWCLRFRAVESLGKAVQGQKCGVNRGSAWWLMWKIFVPQIGHRSLSRILGKIYPYYT